MHASSFYKKVFDFFANVLYPSFCVSCDAGGEWWCHDCQNSVEKIHGTICPRCLFIGEHECSGTLPFNSVTACGYYHDPKLRAIITALKFQGATIVLQNLRNFLTKKTAFDSRVMTYDLSAVIVPMPLAAKRFNERGFNQAELLAQVFKASYNLRQPIEAEILVRTQMRHAQSSLEHDLTLRAKNISGSFACRSKPPRSVILVDDVATTGATAAEAAKILKENGADTVDLMVLAVGA